jgi:post-segregation antitoxin (ccd killing protein)
MRDGPPYDTRARKRTVSLSINGDLLAKAKAARVNVSQVAEAALANTLREHRHAVLREEIQQDIAWIEAYEARHGFFPDMMREFEEEVAEGADA